MVNPRKNAIYCLDFFYFDPGFVELDLLMNRTEQLKAREPFFTKKDLPNFLKWLRLPNL